jgi:hypothetical protein
MEEEKEAREALIYIGILGVFFSIHMARAILSNILWH